MVEIYTKGKATVIFSRHFPRENRNFVMDKLAHVIEYFPEYWNRKIWVGCEGAFSDAKYGGHFISIDDDMVRIRVIKRPSVWLLAHEFMHGIQQIDDNVPSGEKSCDLFTLARGANLATRPPGYLKIPDELKQNWFFWVDTIHEMAKEAIVKRQEGKRMYIKWFENKVAGLVLGWD